MAAWSYFHHVFQLSVCYIVGRTSFYPVCVVNGIAIVLGHRNNKENSEKTVLVHLLVQINQL
jgi:hypothetical protein